MATEDDRRWLGHMSPEEQKKVMAQETRAYYQEQYGRMNGQEKAHVHKVLHEAGIEKQEREEYLKGPRSLPLPSTQDRVVNALARADVERVQAARRNMLAGRRQDLFRSR